MTTQKTQNSQPPRLLLTDKSFFDFSGYFCSSTTTGYWQTTEPCTSIFTSSGITSVLVESGGSTSATAFPMIPGEGINAYSVQVRWQSTDKQISKTSTPTTPEASVSQPASSKSSSHYSHYIKWYLNFPFNSPKSPYYIKRKLTPHR